MLVIRIEAEKGGDAEPGGIGLAREAVEVDLSGGEAGVTKEGGNLVDVITGLLAEHSGGVTKGMDTDFGWIQAGAPGIFLEQATNLTGGERALPGPARWINIREARGAVGEGGEDVGIREDAGEFSGRAEEVFNGIPDYLRALVAAGFAFAGPAVEDPGLFLPGTGIGPR